MKKKTKPLTDFETTLENYIRARVPIIFVPTLEEQRALASIQRVIAYLIFNTKRVNKNNTAGYEFLQWTPLALTTFNYVHEPEDDTYFWSKQETEPDIPFFEQLETLIKQEQTETSETHTVGQPNLTVFCDAHKELSAATAERQLREAAFVLRGTNKTIIFLGPEFKIPETLEPEIKVVPLDLPDFKTMNDLLRPRIEILRKKFGKTIQIDADQIAAFIRATLGLTYIEANDLFSLALARSGKFDREAVETALNEKAKIVRQCQALEYRNPQGSLNDLGGLDNLKAWIGEVSEELDNRQKAIEYGCKLPSGVLMVGPPGTGKSYVGELIAAEWGVPFIQVSISALFGGIVGETAKNFRQLRRLCHAVKPAVLFIDEIEKAIGGDGELDGGTSARLKGDLLTWLQEKPDDLFLAASANDVTKFERSPEFLRRFDEIFWVDLPEPVAREQIARIHLRLAGHDVRHNQELALQLGTIAASSMQGFSGAEIKNVVERAVRSAFRRGAKHPSSADMDVAARGKVPVSRTMAESITRMQKWVEGGRAKKA